MLIRSTWTLTPSTVVSLPRAYHLELAKILHDRMDIVMGEESVPSTTYSGLMGRVTPSQDFLTFSPEESYQLVLCGLQESSSRAIAPLDLSEQLDFLGASFTVSDRQDEITSYEKLYHEMVAVEPDAQPFLDLQFLTPTSFAQGRAYLPLPVPTLLFRSWIERWNHFAPVYLGSDELVEYLGEAIALNRHNIRTHSFKVYKGKMTGFQGTVRLNVMRFADPLLANVANLLAHYAQFSGTGMKTRVGMGQTLKLGQ
ncbi:MAG: CRISPR system precrRNA processing endoribonuclease RAMP protein Cas6 [Cyanothece sp. SIO2G6]|nr:CRISPR system precrRNA processing endoribonuclease RAMP protein Cas6 [Cyanothece sp. SIO2G6]